MEGNAKEQKLKTRRDGGERKEGGEFPSSRPTSCSMFAPSHFHFHFSILLHDIPLN